MAELLGLRRSELALRREQLRPEELITYERWVQDRLSRKPVQRILGYAYFRGLTLELTPDTLIPRYDTESVVDVALERIDRRGGEACILDIGTGSGAIAISIAQERPACEVHASDNSRGALDTASKNAAAAGVQVYFHHADLASGLDPLTGKIDLLISNPPYVPSTEIQGLAPEVRDWDPKPALDGGPDGLYFYRRLFKEARPLLSEGADVVLEIGDGQAEAVMEAGRCTGYTVLDTHPDLSGASRAVVLSWRP